MEKQVPSIGLDVTKVTYEEITPSFGEQRPYMRFSIYLGNHRVNWHIDKKDFVKMADEIKSTLSIVK